MSAIGKASNAPELITELEVIQMKPAVSLFPKSKLIPSILTAVSLGIAGFSNAYADPITFNFTGSVTQIPIDDFATGIEVVLRSNIAKRTMGTKSIMLDGLESILTPQYVADILAWIRAK